MTEDGTTTNFAYDAWGRLTSRTRGSLEANYTWQYGSFLSQVTSNFPGEASQVDYVYDGLSNRRQKLVDSTDYTWTRYDANGAAMADYDYGASYWEIGGRERSFHGGAEIAGSNPLTGTPSYYLRNHLGSTVATTNANKNVVASYEYTPYGEFLSESTTGDHATFGYTGHRLDRELDHYYAKYRYYNPSTMRWLKRDPLGMVDGLNVYAYVRGNVVNAVDLEGLYEMVCVEWGELELVRSIIIIYIDGEMQILPVMRWKKPCLKYEPKNWWNNDCDLIKDLAKCQTEYNNATRKCYKNVSSVPKLTHCLGEALVEQRKCVVDAFE